MALYHIALGNYRPGDGLKPYDLQDADERASWKWDEAEEGADGDGVCVFEALDDALAAMRGDDWAEGGVLVEIAGEIDWDSRYPEWAASKGGDVCRLFARRNEEGYAMLLGEVPAWLLKVVESR